MSGPEVIQGHEKALVGGMEVRTSWKKRQTKHPQKETWRKAGEHSPGITKKKKSHGDKYSIPRGREERR